MATPEAIINMVSSLMNDTAQTTYNNASVLPYLNIALDELQETFEQNNVPATNEVSTILTVPIGTIVIAFTGTTPLLPSNLIDIQQIWESESGQNNWQPMTRREFIPHYLEEEDIGRFIIWVWMDQEITLPPSTLVTDLKLDYIKSIFGTPITIDNIAIDISIINIKSYLGYHTAALCAMFIGENPTRAQVLEGKAIEAESKVLGVSAKGRQAITTRRRPFRASYKTRGI